MAGFAVPLALASSIAARREQLPSESAQTPSPGFASWVSFVVLTVNVAAAAASLGAAPRAGRTV
jgi:hypothetical protein